MNKCILVGVIDGDVNTKALDTTSVSNFKVVTVERFKGKDGTQKEWKDYHRCVAWGNLSDTASTLKDGDRVEVSGKIQTRSWDKDGVKQYITEIKCDTIGIPDLMSIDQSCDDSIPF